MDCMKAMGTSMMIMQTFSATPTPAEALSPSLLTMERFTRKEKPTMKSCRAMGVPKRTMRPSMRQSGRRMSLQPKEKGSLRRLKTQREIRTLTVWLPTVAMAAPAAPMWKTATSSRSVRMLQPQAMATVISGVFESPRPRRMPPKMW